MDLFNVVFKEVREVEYGLAADRLTAYEKAGRYTQIDGHRSDRSQSRLVVSVVLSARECWGNPQGFGHCFYLQVDGADLGFQNNKRPLNE